MTEQSTENHDNSAESSEGPAPSFPELPKLTILSVLGTGTHGTVYLAEHQFLHEKVAVKLLHAEKIGDENGRARFQREAQILSKLEHPNIVRIHSFGITDDGSIYTVMDYVEGRNLDLLVKEQGVLPVEKAVGMVEKLANALQAAHDAGVIHRDVKPGNIIVKADGTPILLDFGIAKTFAATEQKLTATSQIIGTPAYMSPEQAAGKPVNELSDLYSLACVLVYMLTGKPLFSGDSELEVMLKHANDAPPLKNLKISRELRALLSTALAKNPDNRLPNLAQFADRLKNADLSIAPRPAQVLLPLLCLGVICAIFVCGYQLLRQKDLRDETSKVGISSSAGRQLDEVLNPKETNENQIRKECARFIKLPISKTDLHRRILALDRLAAFAIRDKAVDESLGLSKEMLDITGSQKFLNSSTMTETAKVEDRFNALKRAVDANAWAGDYPKQIYFIKQLESLSNKRSAANTPDRQFEILALKCQFFRHVNQLDESRKIETEAIDLAKKQAVDFGSVRTFLEDALVFWLDSNSEPDCERIEAAIQSAANKLGKVKDTAIVILVVESASKLREHNKNKAAMTLLSEVWKAYKLNPLYTPAEKIDFIKYILNMQSDDTFLSLAQTRDLITDFSKYSREALNDNTAFCIDSKIKDAGTLAFNLIRFHDKSGAIRLLQDTDNSLCHDDKRPLPSQLSLLSSILRAWNSRGQPTVSASELADLEKRFRTAIKKEIQTKSLEDGAEFAADALVRIWGTQKRYDESLHLLEETWPVIKTATAIKVEYKLTLLNATLWTYLQTAVNPVVEKEKLAKLRSDLLELLKTAKFKAGSNEAQIAADTIDHMWMLMTKQKDGNSQAEEFKKAANRIKFSS